MTQEAGAEKAQTDANVIRSRLEGLQKTAEQIRDKAQEITVRPRDSAKEPERPAEVKPNTFAVEMNGSLVHIQRVLDDALKALQAFI